MPIKTVDQFPNISFGYKAFQNYFSYFLSLSATKAQFPHSDTTNYFEFFDILYKTTNLNNHI